MELLDLPNELLLAIIVLIGGFDILPCRLICKRVQALIDHSAGSQLSVELASECLAVAPWNNVPAAMLLDRLRRSREAWRSLRPTRVETISLRGDTYLTYEVCGYVFAQGKPGQLAPHLLDEDPFATRMLEFWEMPVGGLMEDARGWHRKCVDVGMDVVDFTLDPSQDALFFVEKQGSRYIFHLRTLSSNLHHPDAKMIEMATEGPLELARCDLQIRDRYIAALILSPTIDGDDVFTMWDWKSGECVLHELGICSYTFLDECTPLLVVAQDDRIAFTTRSPGRPGDANSKSKSEAKAKAKYLMFPEIFDTTAYSHSMVFHDSKLPRPESYPPTSMSFSRSTVPAHADHGIVALSICTFEFDSGEPVRYLVFFLREALARLFRQEQECSLEGGEPYVMDWADWGPTMSRWFVAPSFEQWRCSMHGYRFVTLVTRLEASMYISPSFPQSFADIIVATNDPPPDAPLHLLVFDFNPYPPRRHQHSPPTDNGPSGHGNTVAIAPSDVTFHDREERFAEDVIGRLECRVTLMEEPANYAALAACEDNIIGIQTVSGENDTGGLGHIRVLTF